MNEVLLLWRKTPTQTNKHMIYNYRREEAVFFIYDHNMLKKEEDDLIGAILYFSPEHVSLPFHLYI